jgi:hypothetical protein
LLTAATFDFIEQLDGQTEIASLIEGCQDLIGKFGLHCFMVGDPNQPNVPREERIRASAWPQDWLAHWMAQNYITVDLINNQLLMRNEPVRWLAARGFTDEIGKQILDEAAQF